MNAVYELLLTVCIMVAPGQATCFTGSLPPSLPKAQCEIIAREYTERLTSKAPPGTQVIGEGKCEPKGIDG